MGIFERTPAAIDENAGLKKMLSQTFRLCDELEEKDLKPLSVTPRNGTLRKTLWYDLVFLLFRLSQADGRIKDSESAFIKVYLGQRFKPRRIQELVAENEIYSDLFLRKAPMSVRLFVMAENEARALHPEEPTEYSRQLVRTIDALGQEFLLIDFEKDWKEEDDLRKYLETCTRYIDRNLKEPGGSAQGLEQRAGTE